MKIATFTYSLFISFFPQEVLNEPEAMGTILEPDPLPFTFETIGWKILAVLLVLIFLITLYNQIKLYKKNEYRRVAIKKLEVIESSKAQNQINNLNIILKQVAITSFGREQAAELFGDDWLAFLDTKSKKSQFVKYSVHFSDAIYKNKEVDEITLKEIYKTTKNWIKTHA